MVGEAVVHLVNSQVRDHKTWYKNVCLIRPALTSVLDFTEQMLALVNERGRNL